MTVKMYTLSTCSHCKSAKRFMEMHSIEHEFTDVDLLTGEIRKKILDEIRQYNPACSFPTILVDETVVIGFNEKRLSELLGL